MSMRLLTIGASSSRKSINRAFAIWAGQQFDADLDDVDLNDFEMPIYSEDRQLESGIPSLAHDFKSKIKACDGIIVSFAEHNGSYTAAYKNIFDWASRIDSKVFQSKPMVFLSTSPGARGGASVLALATNSASHFAGDVKASLAIPSFYDNFDVEKHCLCNADLLQKLSAALAHLQD